MAAEQLKQHFDFSTMDKNRINGYCKLCSQNYKDKCGTFSNFLKHLKQKHAPEYEKLFLVQVENSSDAADGSDYRSTTDLSSSTTKQNRIKAPPPSKTDISSGTCYKGEIFRSLSCV